MASNGIVNMSKDLLEEGFDSLQMKDHRKMGGVESKSTDENFGLASCNEAEDGKANSEQKSSCVSFSPQRGLEHCITAPVGTERNSLIADHEIMFSRSITEKRGFLRHDSILDRLSERAKFE